MASKVQIAKMALQHVGDRYDISDITEATPEAEQVNLLYDDTRDALLRQNPWVFATKYVTPAALAGTVPGNWTYMYVYPTDCIRLLGIVNPLGDDQPKIKFEVARNAANNDPEFVMAFSYVLGARMALPLTGDPTIADMLFQQAARVLNAAWASDANEGIEPAIPDADWIRARA